MKPCGTLAIAAFVALKLLLISTLCFQFFKKYFNELWMKSLEKKLVEKFIL